jgi:hypothetical protein
MQSPIEIFEELSRLQLLAFAAQQNESEEGAATRAASQHRADMINKQIYCLRWVLGLEAMNPAQAAAAEASCCSQPTG